MPKPKCSDLSQAISDLALTIGEQDGMADLDKVTTELNRVLDKAGSPPVSRDQVVDSIIEATTSHREALTAAQSQVAALRLEARNDKALRKKIRDLVKMLVDGSRPKGGDRADNASKIIKQLREIASEMSVMVGKSDHALKKAEAKRVSDLEASLAGIRKHITDGTLPESIPSKRAASAKVEALRAEIKIAKKELANSIPARRQRLIDEMDRLADKLTAVQHVPPVQRADVPVAEELRRLVFERNRLRQRLRAKVNSLKPMTLGQKLSEPLDLSRAMMTSMDFSAVLRQGGFIALGHPARGMKSMIPMLKAGWSKQEFARLQDELRDPDQRANALLYASSGLFLADETTNQEEAFLSKWFEKLPVFPGSQRAYIAFLNKLRADTFDEMAATLSKDGNVTEAEAAAIANYINVATGRAKLPGVEGLFDMERSAPLLATAFFAPRLVASRFQLVAGPLQLASGVGQFGAENRVRKEIAKDYARFLRGIAFVLGLGFAAGGELEKDPRSSDFLKLKFGRTRIDFLTGLIQVMVLMAREAPMMLGGGRKKKISTGELVPLAGEDVPFKGDTRSKVAITFARSKLSPALGAFVNIADGKNVVGEEVQALPSFELDEQGNFDLGKFVDTLDAGELGRMLIPLAARDVKDVMVEQGMAKGTAFTLLSLLGAGAQTFGPDMKKQEDLGKALDSLTAPSAGPEGWEALRGVSEDRAVEALKQRARDKHEKAKEKAEEARKAGGKVKRVKPPKFRTREFRARVRKLREGLSKVQ